MERGPNFDEQLAGLPSKETDNGLKTGETGEADEALKDMGAVVLLQKEQAGEEDLQITQKDKRFLGIMGASIRRGALTATAGLALLLAACGGGGGGQRATKDSTKSANTEDSTKLANTEEVQKKPGDAIRAKIEYFNDKLEEAIIRKAEATYNKDKKEIAAAQAEIDRLKKTLEELLKDHYKKEAVKPPADKRTEPGAENPETKRRADSEKKAEDIEEKYQKAKDKAIYAQLVYNKAMSEYNLEYGGLKIGPRNSTIVPLNSEYAIKEATINYRALLEGKFGAATVTRQAAKGVTSTRYVRSIPEEKQKEINDKVLEFNRTAHGVLESYKALIEATAELGAEKARAAERSRR